MKFIASSDNSTKILKLADPKPDLTSAEVQNLMNSAVSAKILYTSKGSLCDTIDSANVIDRNDNELFNLVQ